MMTLDRLGLATLLVSALVPAFGCNGCGPAHNYPGRDDAGVPGVADGGSLEIGVSLNQCPSSGISLSPTSPRVGQSVLLRGEGRDPDSGFVTFKWTATSGTFQDPFAQDTTFQCAEAGPTTITLTISDGKCEMKSMAPIFCVAVSGGGGVGGGSATGAGGGSGGGPGPGPGGSGGSGAGGATANTCPNETTSGKPECPMCTMENCALAAPPEGDSGCCALTDPNDQILCQAVVACFAANSATCTSSGDPTLCFCGTSGAMCYSTIGAANGPCAAQVVAAAKTNIPAMINAQRTSVNSPLGRATNLTTCRGQLCGTECAIR